MRENNLLNEMAIPLKKYEEKIDGYRFQIVENWCLCEYCKIYNQENENYNHWKEELMTHLNSLKKIRIKNNIPKKRILKRVLIDEDDYNDPEMIIQIIIYKFKKENILNKQIIKKIATDFSIEISNIIDYIANDNLSVEEYVDETFY